MKPLVIKTAVITATVVVVLYIASLVPAPRVKL